ncbi:MAG: transcriptional regulator PpsR [Pseudomonadota bacterium]
MTTGASSFWKSGAVPMLEPEIVNGIIGAASDIAIVVDDTAQIKSVIIGQNSDSFGNLDHWEGRPVIEFLADDSIGKFQKAFARHQDGTAPANAIEMNHEDGATFKFPVRYTFHGFGPDNTLLMLGRDLKPIAETQQQLVQAQIALEQGYEARREFDSRYRVMLAKTHEAVVFVNLQDGRISDCSNQAAAYLGVKREAAEGASFAQLLSDRSSAELMESLMNASLAETGGQVEVKADRTDKVLTVEPSVFRASGQRILHCLLTQSGDVAPVSDAETSQALALVRGASDAIVFADTNGGILSANDSFLDLVAAAHSGDVRGKNLNEYLLRGQIDLGVLLENANRTGHMRIYATKLTNELGARLSVEISVTKLNDVSTPVLAFVIRDVSRVEGVRGAGGIAASDDSSKRNVIELVGSASLKDIVAETTDVVEKMCIETAVTLTKNNRVAAAEMLGLSRQSLYVKLRKFGLLSKE